MASPFAVFRRNQKIMLAVVGIGAMIAFVFLTPLMQYMGGGRTVENPVVVETSYGDLTAADLDGLRYQREIVDRFLQRVTVERVARQLGSQNIDSRWLSGLVDQQYMMTRNELMGRAAQGPEESAVETMVLAERAKQMGLMITDKAINDLLRSLTADSLSPTELRDLIRSLSPQQPVSVPRLFEALRTEMLASQYIRLFQLSLNDLPPAQRFEYYARLNRRAKAEVMPLAVADFLPQVADPSKAELQEFYDKYKNDLASPLSPEPGFKEPERATFQYFKANMDQLAEQLKSDVTDEEVAKYYEENKRNFPALSLDEEAPPAEGAPAAGDEAPADLKPTAEPAKEEMKEGEAEQPADKPAEEKPADEKPSEDEPAEEKPADEKPSEDEPADEKPAEEKPSDEPAPEEKPADEAKSEETPAEAPAEDSSDEKPADESAGDQAGHDSRQGRDFRAAGQRFRLVSLLQEEQPAEEPATEPSPQESKPAEEPAKAEEPAAAATEEEKPMPADAPGDTAKPEEAAGEPADPAAEAAPTQPATGDAAPTEEEPQYEPLEKVAETIRGTIARQKAFERINEQIESLKAKMRSYAADYDRYTVERGTNAKAQPPKPLNLSELAEGTAMQPFELTSVSPLEVAKEDLGKSFRVLQTTRGVQTVAFPDFAFADTLAEFRPEETQDNDNNAYLFWKTQQEPSYVPPLDQVRDKVVRAWKMVKARELARKRGQEYAEQARSLGKSLAELFGSQEGLKVTETQPFSWLTFGNVPAQPGTQPRLSEVEGVDAAGPDFMRTVFGLSDGGVGVAMNEPQDLVYVVRVAEFEPSLEALRDAFAREQPSRYLTAAVDDQRQIFQAWIKDLNQEADVHWMRQADVRSETPDDEEL